MLGAPASISWGRSFLSLLCSGPSSLARPDALSPPPAARCRVVSCVSAQTTSERLPLPGRSTPSPAFLALSGRGDATFHVGLNFALTEFSEVPCLGRCSLHALISTATVRTIDLDRVDGRSLVHEGLFRRPAPESCPSRTAARHLQIPGRPPLRH